MTHSILLLVSSTTTAAGTIGQNLVGFSFLLSVIVWAPALMAIVVAGLPGSRGLYGRSDVAQVARNTALATIVGVLVLCLLGYIQFQAFTTGIQFEERLPWLPDIGIGYHLGVDGVGITMLLLGQIVGAVAVAASTAIRERSRAYFSMLLLAQSAFNGVVAAQDMFVLLLFWAAAAVPLTLVIAGWGGPARLAAASRFFAYAALGTAALVGAVLVAYLGTGGRSFDLSTLASVQPPRQVQVVAGIGLVVAAASRLPLFPLHGWIRALAECPVGVAIFIAGASGRLGGYILLRILVADLHSGARAIAGGIAVLGALTVLYAAIAALRANDIRVAAAYASMVPGGMAVLAVSALSPLGADAATLELFAGGLAAALLVGVAAVVAVRAQGRSLLVIGGTAPRMPRLAWLVVLAALSVIGVPGFGSFVSQLMTLMSSARPQPLATAGALVGLALCIAWVASLLHRVLFREPNPDAPGVTDASLGESWYLGVLAGVLLWVGLLPSGPKLAGQPLLDPGIANVANAGAAQLASPYVPGATTPGTTP